MKLSNSLYDILKWVSLVLLPAFSVMYAALSGVWGFTHVQEIITTVAAIETFVGALIGISAGAHKQSKYAGDLNVTQGQDGIDLGLALEAPPEEMLDQKEVIFKVRK